MVDFEKAFDGFIDRREYGQATNALFSMIRIAFTAGWLAAGGEAPRLQKILKLIQPKTTAIPNKDAISTDIVIDYDSK